MELWSSRRMAVGVVTRRYGGIEAGCKRAVVEAKRYCTAEVRCRRADVEMSRNGDEEWRSGALEACCACRVGEEFA